MEVIKVSSRQTPGTYINEAKTKLAANASVELSALETGINTAVKAAEFLVHLGYAKLSRFETSLLENDGDAGRFKGLTKVSIKLDKAATFDKAARDFEESRLKRGSIIMSCYSTRRKPASVKYVWDRRREGRGGMKSVDLGLRFIGKNWYMDRPCECGFSKDRGKRVMAHEKRMSRLIYSMYCDY